MCYLATQQPPPTVTLPSTGVQPVINAVVRGSFNVPGPKKSGGVGTVRVIYGDAQAAVIAAVAAGGGIGLQDVKQSLAKLYGELLKHHHGGVTDTIHIRHGEQTLAEAIAAMSILLFARWRYASQLDADYTDETGMITVVSKL